MVTVRYPRAGLNGLQFIALDTRDAEATLAGLRADGRVEVVSAIPYRFNGGAQAGYVAVIYDAAHDPGAEDAEARAEREMVEESLRMNG